MNRVESSVPGVDSMSLPEVFATMMRECPPKRSTLLFVGAAAVAGGIIFSRIRRKKRHSLEKIKKR